MPLLSSPKYLARLSGQSFSSLTCSKSQWRASTFSLRLSLCSCERHFQPGNQICESYRRLNDSHTSTTAECTAHFTGCEKSLNEWRVSVFQRCISFGLSKNPLFAIEEKSDRALLFWYEVCCAVTHLESVDLMQKLCVLKLSVSSHLHLCQSVLFCLSFILQLCLQCRVLHLQMPRKCKC